VSDTLIVELLTEELPPKALPRLGEAFAAGIEAGLRARGFLAEASRTVGYATPRRLAVAITHVEDSITEPARAVALVPVNVAFDDGGKPTPALDKAIKAKTGFETATAVPPDRLERRSDGKLERLFYIEPPVAIRLRSARSTSRSRSFSSWSSHPCSRSSSSLWESTWSAARAIAARGSIARNGSPEGARSSC